MSSKNSNKSRGTTQVELGKAYQERFQAGFELFNKTRLKKKSHSRSFCVEQEIFDKKKNAIGDVDCIYILKKDVTTSDLFPSTATVSHRDKVLVKGTILSFELTSMAGQQTMDGGPTSKVSKKIVFFKKMKRPEFYGQLTGISKFDPNKCIFVFVYNGADFVCVKKQFDRSDISNQFLCVHLPNLACIDWQKDAEKDALVAEVAEKDALVDALVAEKDALVAEMAEKDALIAELKRMKKKRKAVRDV
jgi:hypothetical protein